MSKKILICDDDLRIIEVVKARLTAVGYDVVVAFNGAEGIDQVRREKPDLLILDFMMPKLDGHEVVRALRADEQTKDLPIVIFTANDRMQTMFKVEGITDYLTKPFRSEELLRIMRKYLGGGYEGPKILIVDDEPNIITIITARLKAAGYAVITAANGLEGLEAIKREEPDLIVLDVMMPEMDGFEFYKHIKENEASTMIPIIMLTARGAMKSTFEAMGVDTFIPKPFDAQHLLETIEFCLAKKVMCLSSDQRVIGKIEKVCQPRDLRPVIVASEEDLMKQGNEIKAQMIILHMPKIISSPEEMMAGIRRLKTKHAPVLIYCDASVKGTEDGSTVEIERLKHMWMRAGAQAFFDVRLEGDIFGRILDNCLEKISAGERKSF